MTPLVAAALEVARRVSRRFRRSRIGNRLDHPRLDRLRGRLLPAMGPQDVLDSVACLSSAGISAWVAGGWGVDALAGRQTRRHRDLDLVIDREALERAISCLQALGYRRQRELVAELVPGSLLPERAVLANAVGQVVDLHPVDLETWAPVGDAAPFATGTIASRSVGCLSADVQRAGRRGYSLDVDDHHDLSLLDGFDHGA